jgi:mono/diheme cytochrome c family protein
MRRGLVFAAVLLSAAGCRQDMHNQPKAIPLRESMFFKNAAVFTGKENGAEVDALPLPLTADVLDRGQQRYDIYCSPCHDVTGSGRGMIVRRGYKQPPSYHTDRLRQAPIGHFYDVMTNGFGAMPDYKAQIAPRDRWAIAAYIRALQLSQHASLADVPQQDRQKLQ